MSDNYSAPVPPTGAHSEYDASMYTSTGNGNKNKKSKKQGGAGKSFLSGLVGGIVAFALMGCLWQYTPALNAFKSTSTSGGSAGSSNITISNTEDTTTAEAVSAKCLNSVVTIYVYAKNSTDWTDLFGEGSGSSNSTTPSGLGSGVIVKVDGDTAYILTNYHVVEDISRAVVKVGEAQYEATAVGSDPSSDLAVISIQASGLTAAEWGDSNSLNVGEWVCAIGSPYGYENTVTTGIVSALYRSDVLSSESGLGQTVYTGMIQTDAAINPGNSGGGLFNAEGQLIGINTYISSTSQSSAGLGFAIPSSSAKDIAETLISGQEVSHAFLGVSMSTSTDPAGVLVTSVYKDTAAAKAGLKTGDVITKVDDSKISSTSDLSVAVSSHKAGDTVTITYIRDGNEATTQATLGSANDSTDEYAEGGEPETESDSGNSGNDNGYGYDLGDLFGWGDEYGYGGNSGNGNGGNGNGSGNGFWGN